MRELSALAFLYFRFWRLFLNTLNLSRLGFFENLYWDRGKFGISIHYWACRFIGLVDFWVPLKKIKIKNPNGRISRIGRILYDPTILYDSIRSYHFCDPTTILIFLVRWDRKIVRFYNPDRDFDNLVSKWSYPSLMRVFFNHINVQLKKGNPLIYSIDVVDLFN